MRLSIGTHNLLDGAGIATPFADLLLFTESPSIREIRADLGEGYAVRRCRWQRDLTLAWRRSAPIEYLGQAYRFVHPGIPLVTPHRGTCAFKLRIADLPVKVPAGHRINGAFPPFKRGEPRLRPALWQRHADLDDLLIGRSIDKGWDIIAGGDLNTPPSVKGYAADLGLTEVRRGLDRLATTFPLDRGSVRVLGNVGSDHPRLYAEVIL